MSQAIVQKPQVAIEKKQEISVNNIARMRGMTRSGQCYAPINSEAREWENFAESGKIKIVVSKRKDKELMNESVTKIEANEFLKFIKHSEYIIVE